MDLSRGATELLRRLTFLSQQRGYAFPSQEWLADRMGCTVRTIKRYVRELREAGLITTKKRQHETARYEIQKGQSVPSEVPSSVPSAAAHLISSEQPRERTLKQHHRDDVDVALAHEPIRKAAGVERLSAGDRKFLAEQLQAGISERQIVAGIILGRTRKMTGAGGPIHCLKYFEATIMEAATLTAAYIQHCENWIKRQDAKRSASG